MAMANRSPIKRLKQKESNGRIRFLSDDERDRLLQFSFHCLRHTAASWLAQANVSGPIIQKILNHRSSNISARYIHFAQNHLQEALEKMNNTFLSEEIV